MTSPAERAMALKALKERAGTEAEAIAAAKALAKHLAKHRLEMAELEGESEVALFGGGGPVEEGQRIAGWRYNLISGLGRLYGCVPWVECTYPKGQRRPRGRKRRFVRRLVHLCGLREDVARVRQLYEVLAADVDRFGREHDGHRTSFRIGFVQGLLDGANAGAEEAKTECTALVHVDARYDDAARALKTAFDLDAPKPMYSDVEEQSYRRGYDEGQKRHVGERLAGD